MVEAAKKVEVEVKKEATGVAKKKEVMANSEEKKQAKAKFETSGRLQNVRQLMEYH
jgi:hypothetical protein